MFTLEIGCHSGTITSRDIDIREFPTLQEAVKSHNESKRLWARMGYMVWYAHIKNDSGATVRTFSGNSYRR